MLFLTKLTEIFEQNYCYGITITIAYFILKGFARSFITMKCQKLNKKQGIFKDGRISTGLIKNYVLKKYSKK